MVCATHTHISGDGKEPPRSLSAARCLIGLSPIGDEPVLRASRPLACLPRCTLRDDVLNAAASSSRARCLSCGPIGPLLSSARPPLAAPLVVVAWPLLRRTVGRTPPRNTTQIQAKYSSLGSIWPKTSGELSNIFNQLCKGVGGVAKFSKWNFFERGCDRKYTY
jgi:hypothetical protein